MQSTAFGCIIISDTAHGGRDIEVERLFRVSAIVDIFDSEADSREQRFLKRERNTDDEIDFGKIFKSACDDLKSTG